MHASSDACKKQVVSYLNPAIAIGLLAAYVKASALSCQQTDHEC